MAQTTLLTFRDGVFRIYDGTATPFYLEIPFMNANFTAGVGRPRPVEMPILNRQRLKNTNAYHHYIAGSDQPVLEPMRLSFSFGIATQGVYSKVREALNVDMAATWTVGLNTWVTTKGTTQVLSGGASPALVTTPVFADARKRTVNIEVLWEDPIGADDQGSRWAEVFFPPEQQSFNEQENMVEWRAQGDVYGNVGIITAFTSGTAG